MKKIVIIGAGASGLFSAINMSNEKYEITILEANDKPGKKILATGNGRCNITNSLMTKNEFYCKNFNFVDNVLNKFNYKDTLSSFENIGINTKDKDGYIYPNSMQASTVLNALLSICSIKGIKIVSNTVVTSITKDNSGKFYISATTDSEHIIYEADKLLIACGSKASVKYDYSKNIYDYLSEEGHTINRLMPALCSVYASFNKKQKYIKDFFKNTQGVRTDISCDLYYKDNLINSSQGELQITDYGFSGIVIFQISGHISRLIRDKKENDIILCVDFIPNMNESNVLSLFKSQMYYEKKSLQDLFNGIINNKLAHELLMLYSNKIDNNVKPFNKKTDDNKLIEIIRFMKKCYFNIETTNSYKFAQVCTGGIDVDDITNELESVHVKNLYFSGECIDVDGICGGYNLQWAWSTGYVAGRSMTND